MYENHIFLDFEMNPIPRDFREAREIARAEIVEIGAVKLDREYRLVDRYSRFVKPEYGPIQPHITRLTGITDADVAGALPFAPAMEAFGEWIGPGRTRIYSWSRTDQDQLYDESWLKEAPLPSALEGGWMDFQLVYARLLGLSGANSLSLKNALGSAACQFEGEAHRAVHDAENSATLLILAKEGRLKEQTGALWESLHGQVHNGATLGQSSEALRRYLEQVGH